MHDAKEGSSQEIKSGPSTTTSRTPSHGSCHSSAQLKVCGCIQQKSETALVRPTPLSRETSVMGDLLSPPRLDLSFVCHPPGTKRESLAEIGHYAESLRFGNKPSIPLKWLCNLSGFIDFPLGRFHTIYRRSSKRKLPIPWHSSNHPASPCSC
jgi:hypothetical protein